MSCDFIALANAGVQGISPYQAGKPMEELQRELGLEHIVKLASNENPLGPSRRASAAIENSLSDLTRYPDSNGFELKRALAERHGVASSQITLGNGSNNVLNLVALAYLDAGRSAVYSEHAFVVYPLAVKTCGARAIVTPARDWGHDPDAMAAAVEDDTAVVFFANPNNPTGTWVDETALVSMLDRIPPHVIVVLDEAYIEYVADAGAPGSRCPDGVSLLQRYPNLIVTRTFSKVWGLAGCRVGYALASEAITDVLNRVREPFNVSAPAMAAARAVLDDTAYLQHSREVNSAGMEQLVEGVGALGLDYIPSAGNFLTVEFSGDCSDIYQRLLREGVIVRPIGVYGMPRHLRISIGLEAENRLLLDALQKIL